MTVKALNGRSVILRDGELLRRERDNRAYMLRLTRENLMRNYLFEAGLWADDDLDPAIHGGWESPTCALRGHFTGHYLSAAAMIYNATGDDEIKGRADAMVDDLARCLYTAELPLGILTAVIGAPFFLLLLRRRGGAA